jgi:hypothetical protein
MRLLRATRAQVKRAQGAYVDGVWSRNADETFFIDCNIQPYTDNYFSRSEIEQWGFLPDSLKIVFTREFLRFSNPDSQGEKDFDIVVISAKDFAVVGAQEWSLSVLKGMRANHNAYLVHEMVIK